jgi:hypothetical protein
LKYNPEIKQYVSEIKYIITNSLNLEKIRNQFELKKPKKKKLVKKLKNESQKIDPIKGEEKESSSEEENGKENLPEGFSDEEIDGDTVIRVYPNSQKKEVKNMNVKIKAKITEANGDNRIVVNGKIFNNLKKTDSFDIPPLVTYQINNYSAKDLKIMFKLIEEN